MTDALASGVCPVAAFEKREPAGAVRFAAVGQIHVRKTAIWWVGADRRLAGGGAFACWACGS
jgi:hypothetical protein